LHSLKTVDFHGPVSASAINRRHETIQHHTQIYPIRVRLSYTKCMTANQPFNASLTALALRVP
jgi:hypothetical protein